MTVALLTIPTRADRIGSRRRFAGYLSSASVLALASTSVATGSHSALAAATCTMGTASGTTTTINLNGTTCTAPFAAGYTTTNVTNNPQTPTPATQPGTLYQDASALANLNGASSFTVGGTISDGTGPTSVYLNLPNFTLISNIVSTYTGTTTIAGGTLMLGIAASLSANSSHSVLTGGILDLGGTTQSLGTPLMLQGGTVQNGSITGAVSSSGGSIVNTNVSGNLVTTAGITTVSGTDNVGSVINGSTINVTGTLNIYSGLTNNGTFNVPGGTYNISQPSTVTNNGIFNASYSSNTLTAINNAGATWNGSVVSNNYLITNYGTWNGDITNNAGGTITNAGTWTTSSAGLANAGMFTTTGVLNVSTGGLSNSGTFNASGSLVGAVTNTGTFNVKGPLTGITSFTQQAGTLDLGSMTLSVSNPLMLTGGTIANGSVGGAIVSSGGTISNITNTAVVATSGTTTIQSGSFTALYTSQGASVTAANGLSFSGMTGVGGVGTINGNLSVGNGAAVAPGTFAATAGAAGYTVANTGPGTLTVNGNVALANGSVFQVAATPTQASFLSVSGTTTINGASVAVYPAGGTYSPSTTYTILTSSKGLSGTFNGAGFASTNTSAFMTPTLSYDANDAYLTLTRNGTTVQSMATTNTSSEAGVINAAPNTALGRAFLNLPANQVQNALNAVSGEANTQVQTAGTQATRAFTNFISDRATPSGAGGQGSVEVTSGAGVPAGALGYVALNSKESPIVVDRPKPAQGMRIFATGFGGGSSLQGQNGDVAGQTGSYYGGLMGIDYRVTPDLLVGAAAGGSSSNFLVASRSSSGSVTGFNGNVFAIASAGAFYGQTLTTFSAFSNSTARSVAGFGGLASALEKASFGSHEVRERLEFGRVVDVAAKTGITGFKVTPFVAMEIARLDASGYSESNASGGANVFGLTASGKTFDDARSFLGARLEASYDLGKGMTLRPIVRLAWVHAFTTAPSSTNTFQNIPGTSFVITGATVARDAAETKAGAELAIGKSTVLFANFDGEFASIQQVYGGRAGFRFSF